MGQRGQVSVIAKVNGRYRVLAAVHNQWLYGSLTLLTILSVIRIFKTEADPIHIRRELRRAEHTDWEKDGNFASVFPFILTCLVVGAALFRDRGQGDTPNISPLSIGTTPQDIDNNDGIPVIDITDLTAPSYAIFFLENRDPREFDDGESWDEDDGREVHIIPGLAVLDGMAYVRTYHSTDQPDDPTRNEILSLPLMPVDILRDVWPGTKWEKTNEFTAESTSSPQSAVPDLKRISFTRLR